MNGLVTMDYHPHHPLYWHRHHQQHGKRLCRSMSKPFKAGGELSGDLCYRGHTPYMDVAILLRPAHPTPIWGRGWCWGRFHENQDEDEDKDWKLMVRERERCGCRICAADPTVYRLQWLASNTASAIPQKVKSMFINYLLTDLRNQSFNRPFWCLIV